MGSLFAYMGSDPERLRAALLAHREFLRVQSAVAPGGDAIASCGLGFYQGGEVLLQRRPRLAPVDPAGTLVDLYEMARELRTDVLLSQVRLHAATRLAKNENTPPFRFRSWLFTHQGQIPALEKQQEELLKSMPDFLRRNVRGQTDTELFFHLFLAALHEGGSANLEDANLTPEVVLRALTRAVARVVEGAKRSATPPGPQLIALTNGRLLVTLRHGEGAAPLGFLRLGAVNDGGRSYEHFRGVLMSSVVAAPAAEGAEPPAALEQIPVDHALLVGRDLNPRVVPAR